MSSVKNAKKLKEPKNGSISLFELKAKGTLCDVQLCLQGTTILAHACVLASCSSYFLKLFQVNQEIHWCAKNPLLIDLENLLGSSKDVCFSCVSKMVDFMYLRELVILKNHYEHFVALNSLFHIFDPMPMSKNLKETNLSNTAKMNSPTIEQFLDKPIVKKSDDSLVNSPSENVIDSSSKDTDLTLNSSLTTKLRCVINKTGKSSGCENGKRSFIPIAPEAICKVNSKPENIKHPTYVALNTIGASVKVHSMLNKETEMNKTCEFMCCNPEPDITSSRSKVRKRRIMHCEICDFSSVSLRKILQHLQSTDHFKNSCPVCLRKIQNINDFKEHLKDHTNAKPFICHICNKRNRYWDYHKMHLKIHCKNKPFYCDLCQRGFLSKRSLAEHFDTHKGSYLCKECDYYTSDLNMYRSHLCQHGKEDSTPDSSSVSLNTDSEVTKQRVKKFQCQVCSEKFTQKKNLARHLKLKHFDIMKFKCSMCAYATKRSDILKNHMKKRHNFTLVKEKCQREKKAHKDNPDFVNVLIPVQLISNTTTEAAFVSEGYGTGLTCAVKTGVKHTNDQNNLFSHSHVMIHQNPNLEQLYVEGQVIGEKKLEDQNDSFSLSSDFLQNKICSESGSLITDSTKADPNDSSISENVNSNVQLSYMTSSHSFEVNVDSSEQFLNTETVNDSDPSLGKDVKAVNREEDITDILEGNKYIWLNEATGELLSGETLANIQAQKLIGNTSQKVSGTENSTLDFCDQLKNTILSEATGEFSSFDVRDDNEEWQFPQTPQASVVGIDECDNLFPWNQVDNSFYSTWVLNETTGELNMVSFFSIQSVKSPAELNLSENKNAESLTPVEDDDTALFLNEGTGDLSVIYFNPNRPGTSDLKIHPYEKLTHDNLETLSDSDDDSDLLNEEFMRVSASFMSNEENEKFLNELTGEFDIASLNNYQPEVLNNQSQARGDESYLNEETGEISWNVMDDNVNNETFTKSDNLEYDVDDSLNCEDFESFFGGVSDFSAQFCLDDASKNWQSADEAGDSLVLNECTGELVKRT